MHAVHVILLGESSVIIGRHDGIYVILMQLHQHAMLGHAIDGYILFRGKHIVSVLGTVVRTCNEVVDEGIMETETLFIDIPADILFEVCHDSGNHLIVELGKLCLVDRSIIGSLRHLVGTEIDTLVSAVFPQSGIHPLLVYEIVSLQNISIIALRTPVLELGVLRLVRQLEITESAHVMLDSRSMQIDEVEYLSYSIGQIVLRIFLSVYLGSGSCVKIDALQSVVEVTLIVWRIGNDFRAVFVQRKRNSHVRQVVVVIRTLKHSEVRIKLLDISPRWLIHLSCSEITSATEYRLAVIFTLCKEIYRFCIFGDSCGRAGLLKRVFAHNDVVKVVEKTTTSGKMRLHGRGIVDFQHQLHSVRSIEAHLIASTTVLAVAVNPSVRNLYRWYSGYLYVSIELGLILYRIILSEITTIDSYEAFCFLRLGIGNRVLQYPGKVESEIYERYDDNTCIRNLGLVIRVEVSICGRTLTLILHLGLLADGT